MGSFVMRKSSTCFKHICPLIRQTVYHGHVVSVLQKSRPLTVRPFCSRGERSSTESQRRDPQRDFTLRKRPAFPKSVFAAGNARRTTERLTRKAGLEEKEQDVGVVRGRASVTDEVPHQPLSVSEWRKVKESSSRPERFEVRMMEGMLAAGAHIDIAKSLLAYVAVEKGTLPYELLLRYLTLCVGGGHHSEVWDTYDIMMRCFKALDTGAYSLFVKGFSQTERWREALSILEDMKKIITPSSRNYGDAIAGACRHGDIETGWALYAELMDLSIVPNQDTWQCLFESSIMQRGHREKLLSILHYMRENQVYPEEPLVRSIKSWFESLPDEKWKGRLTTVDSRGECRSCRALLESIQLTEEEYVQLKERVMTDVIEGKDVFTKTTPEELEEFKSFVKKRPAFDVVIDGLNVANLTPKSAKSETLLAVVSELQKQGLNILVLGRKHMLRPSRNWNRDDINQIKQKAHCFFTDNISEDDPFLLYATLHSGNHCNFVSRDLMRDHKACLSVSSTMRLFFKWQRGHQLVVSWYVPGKRVQFQRPLSFDTIVQKTDDTWHIPYDEEGGDRSTYEVPQRWLCLTKEL